MATGTIRLARFTAFPPYYIGLGLVLTMAAAIADPRSVADWITDALVPAVESHGAIAPAQPAEPAIIEVASAAAAGSNGSWPKSSWPEPGEALPSKSILPFETQAVNAVLTFQQGVSGYTGTVDTYIEEANPATNRGGDPSIFMDNSPNRQALIRFDGIFGGIVSSQIPPGSTIHSATLTVNVNDASNTGAAFHRMLACWADTNTWNTFVAGIQADGTEAVTTADVSSLQDSLGTLNIDVTSSLVAWSAGATNLGWAALPLGASGWGLDSAQGTVKPLLSVTFTPPAACTIDANCDDGNGCTTDTCNTGTGYCDHAANPGGSCTDGIACTTDTCSACGRCASVDSCTLPNVCNAGSGQCDVPPAPPSLPTNPSPADAATGVSTSQQLCVDVSDPNGGNLTVTFKGRESEEVIGPPFTVIALPDTQFYSQTFTSVAISQMQWIRDNRVARNIVAVTELGDCVNNADQLTQWTNASAAHDILENPTTTGLTDGISYGVAVGNHDQFPAGAARTGADENVTTINYNATFPKSRFAGRAYHGGNYPLTGFTDSMDNHYELFSASGMDFIVFHLEWDDGGGCSWPVDGTPPTGTLNTCQNVLSWVRSLLTTTHSNRRAIISTHFMGTPGSGGAGTTGLSDQGRAIVHMAKGIPNVFLTLGGHLDQAFHWTNPANDGHPIYTLVSDYQTRPNGGNGWLRIMTFDPAADTIHIETYSPTVEGGRFINKPLEHADNEPNGTTENELTLAYAMDPGLPFQTIGVNTLVPSGTRTCRTWSGLTPNQLHEWKVEVSDGTYTTDPIWSFTTGSSCAIDADCDDSDLCTTDTCTLPAGTCNNVAIPLCCTTAGQCDDANVCTTDSCNGGNTCDHVDNAASCSDGNACTTSDSCSSGACVGGVAPNCNDANACTTDSCVPATGCANAYAPAAGCCASSADCNDGNAATTDLCALPAGNCSNAPNISCTTSAECNDGNNCTNDACVGGNASALSFDGTNDYVTMQQALGLNAETFTVEFWFRWTGATPGATILTGATGGITLVPLVAKGAPEADATAVDANYIVGLRDAGGGSWTLAADMEEHSSGSTPGLNHAVLGTIPIAANTWHHAAAVYDRSGAGTGTWRLFLDGNPDTTVFVGQPPNYVCTQYFALGTCLTSGGAQANNSGVGQFRGLLDEVRVWNRPLSQAEIQAGMNQELVSGTGLLARWGLNENSGTAAADTISSPAAENGTLTNGTSWSPTEKPNLGTGTCQYGAVALCCNTAAQCNDSNPCTADSCLGNLCQNAAISGCCLTSADCNDSNVCTDDSCNLGSNTCEHANNIAPCSDGNICTTSDACGGGSCQPGTAVPNCCLADAACNDGNACTSDYCATTNDAALSLASPGATGNRVDLALGTGSNASPDYINYFGTSSFTIEGWIYTDGGAAASTGVFRHGRQGAFAQVVVQLTGTGNLQLMGSVESNALGQVDVTSPTVLTANTWNHFALVVDRTGTQLRLYVNGGTPTSAATAWGANFISSTDQSMIGAARDSAGGLILPYDGRIDEVRIWNYARTQTQIAADMGHEIESATGLVHRWSFNAGTGTTAVDAIGGITGTLVGTAAWSTTNLAFAGSDSCVYGNVANGSSCSDGDACTTTDVCTTGVCAGTAINCDDGNACTADSCSGGVCSHVATNEGGTCTDNSACTTGDACSGGACVGTTITCNDSNPCTDDSCNPGTGCVYTNDNTNACTDGIACTADACASGACQSWYAPTAGCCGSDANCNDGVAATTDTCVGPPNGTCSNLVTGACTTAGQCNDSNGCTTDACVGAVGGPGLRFDGTDDNVSMGAAPGLGSAQFTIETWFKRTGTGIANTTGTGGIAALVPLVTKGAPEADASAVDANYILGINTAGNVLAADFEQFGVCTGGTGNCSTLPYGAGCFCDINANCQSNVCANPGLNRPVSGTTAIVNNTWYHAAATYDGTTWRLYLNGNIEATLVVGAFTPRSNSTQYAGLGAMLTSGGARLGAFQGLLDEVRIWNVARSQALIQADMNLELTSGTGLVGRWGLNETSGTTAADSATSPTTENGTLRNGTVTATLGNGPVWINDSPIGAVPGSCTNTPIASCTTCTSDFQCNDSNQCTTDYCNHNGAALSFPSRGVTTDHVDLALGTGSNASPDYVNFFGTSSFTIEGWVYTAGTSVAGSSVFRVGRSGDFPLVALQLTSGLQLQASVEANATGGDQVDIAASAVLVANTWTHFAVVVDRSINQLRLHLNGGTPASGATGNAWTTSNISSTDTTVLGVARDSAGVVTLPFVGRLDELRIWNSARTQAEIAANMSAELASAPGLVHRWSFNAGTGATAVDSVGSITGTLGGVTTWATTPLPFAGSDTCVHANLTNGTACSDGNVCTQSDSCQSGACTSGTPASGGTACGSSSDTACDNPDTCDGAGACQSNTETNGAICSDGNACTNGDACAGGVCVSGSAQVCDDGNPCTTDSCNTGTGCVFTPITGGGTISCGIGACSNTVPACVGGVVNTCTPGSPSAEICDGIDNNCDGQTDEALGTISCGTGACQNTVPACVAGVPNTCTPGSPSAEICDGIDNDCNGSIDDGLGTITCGTGACQNTVAACVAGVPNTCTPGTPSAEVCDGIDNDCNGSIDDGLGTITCGTGACQNTVAACVAGVPNTCTPGTPSAEICDGIDNDCNGSIDDGLGTITCGTGACQSTVPACVGGSTNTCTPGTPSAEICDGIDNDCNGTVDDGLGTITCGTGACQSTVPACVGGAPNTCIPGSSSPEVCDGVDNDCNGSTDDGLGTITCGTGACQSTVPACVGGSTNTCEPGLPSPEVCDGIDNDCDGTVDDGLGTITCGTGACESTVPACVGGSTNTCEPGLPSPEVCDGTDNDCDGTVDDGLGTISCGVGACENTVPACVGGSTNTCEPGLASPEICDGIDNDCDGTVDDGLGTISCGVGACESTVPACVGGSTSTCEPGLPSPEVCDGIDNDCDGTVDDGLGTISCGVGACENTVPACVGGSTNTCEPGLPSPEVCDGTDNDCDGTVDDGLGTITCGTGACESTVPACVGGSTNTCEPGLASPEVCDGIDNDCDGTVDDGLGTITCGTGACENTVPACVAGVPNTCTPGSPSAEICDGIDNNCDGSTDEGLGSTICGIGACQVTVQNCVGGVPQTCVPGAPSAEICDGIDNNCDGTVDDGLGTITCGTGACQSTVAACVAGVPNTCTPGSPSAEVCDGIDNDCNGSTDDGLGTITCGTGACQSTVAACVAGVPNTCTPGSPSAEVCDGIDNDCNGSTDEGLGSTTCGSGACQVTVQNCVGGVPQSCVPGDESPEVCDGIDNDCNGSTDDGLGTITCGTGACQNTVPACVGGIANTCTPGSSSPEVCDGLDNDCDGSTDEGLGTISCGTGACQNTVPACVAGVPNTCTPGSPSAEVCDGIDNDCNGSTDDGLGTITCGTGACESTVPACVGGSTNTCEPGLPSPEVCDGTDNDCDGTVDDGLGTITCGTGACESTVPACVGGSTNTCEPGLASPEVCDGIDNDCDGTVDDGLGTITCGTGACENTVPACVAGVPNTCTPGSPSAEICDGIDNNCDGSTDEGLGSTICGIGACQVTVQNCVGGVPQTCVPGAPSAEICDGIDNNCDGQTDEALGTITCGTGACQNTVPACVGGSTNTCEPGLASPEVCDGIDNDCDGTVDDGLGTITCGTGACQSTVAACVAGVPNTCTPGSPSAEICDGIDNNCDGSTDEGLGSTICGIGACQVTVQNCVGGVPQTCVPGAPSAEVCDGIDNNCDGQTDEALGTITCGTGACQNTVPACVGGIANTCTPGSSSPEVCDGLDNDCDGSTDEGLGTISCGTGACQNTVPACVAGVPNTCTPGSPSAEVCDGIDNDCNGSTDDGLGTITCGTGACESTVPACVGGSTNTCEPGLASPEVCDGIDNDCDGSTDEGLGSTTCGTGACQVTVQNCVGGVPQTCVPGTPSAEVCDGIDNNCDGQTDEALGTITCGTGACENTVPACVAGVPNTCTAGSPSAEICDGIDNDCNGSTDEGLGSTTCGTGACQVTVQNCVGGVPQTCVPGSPSAEVCDGIDNNCDGQTDEALGTITCGTGACQNTVAACVAGVPNTCTPGTPSAEICDGIDNDCNGSTDEGLGSTTCGTGACQVTVQNCVGGVPQTCVPGTPSAEVCDGIDNNCNGSTDEGLGTITCGTGACENTVPACVAGVPNTCTPGSPSAEICDGIDNDCNGSTDEGLGSTTCGAGACQVTVQNCVGGVPQTCVPGTPSSEICDGIDNNCNGATDENPLVLCDDSTACTTDACNGVTGCSHTAITCNDSNLCTTDTCVPASGCAFAPVACSVGFACNPGNGICEPTAAPPLPIVVGDTWRYFKGTAEPAPPPNPPTWAAIGYDDGLWLQGPSGFGYGADGCMAQVGTTFTDMQSTPNPPGYFSIYARRKFDIVNPAAVVSLTATVDFDDSVVVYVNGTEVGRSTSMGGTAGTPTAFNTPAAGGHECSVCDAPPCIAPQSFTISPGLLVAGTNVIAIHAHNQSLTSSDFILIPTVTATLSQCTLDADCNDGVACTTDTCAASVCQHTSNCSGGQTCNVGTGLCELAPVTVTFQQGTGSPVYNGTVDTFIQSGSSANNSAVTPLTVDGVPPTTDERQILIRFDNIFGNGAGQIPAGATVTSATLEVNVTNAMAQLTSFNRMLQTWSPADIWSAYGSVPWNATPGVQADGVEAIGLDEPGSPASLVLSPPMQSINLTTSVQAWAANPASNFGWVLRAAAADSLVFDSSEGATATLRPKLTIVYLPPASNCTIDADCSDNNVCNGIETCVATVCQPGTALNCDDSNVCTTDSCHPTLGCQTANNTLACNDADACTSGDVCAAGICSGVAISCDDGVACTADSCSTGTGCQHASTCTGGQTCNLTSGLCESGPVTVTFQQGAAGYGGSADTFIDVALGSQATVSPIVIDASPVEQGLLKFDAIFGSSPGQIPAGSTITSATLTLWAGAGANDQSANPVNLHLLLHAWIDTGVWADYGLAPWNAAAGIQNDGADALAAVAGTATITTAATSAAINVTTSLQAWSSSPSTNFGWAILPTGTDGLRVESNESTTAANTRRPLLSVTFTPPVGGCSNNAQCDDGDACNGLETCVATVCQPGTTLVCNDGNVCTTDTCAPVSGCVFTNNTAACDDNNACTTSDTCASGSCVGGAALVCNDSNLCTTDTCAPASGCVFTNNTAACNDNDACTTSDACAAGSCVGGPALVCNDGNVCTTDTCNPASGCETTPITGGGTTTCGLGVCQVTVTSCIAGVPQACTPGLASTEVCDGLDNNCDGSTDENGAAMCADDNTCNGIETCGGASGCQTGPPPVVMSTISIPDLVTGPAGGTVSVPVLAQAAAGIGIDLTVTFDPAVLQPTSVVKSLLTQDGSLTFNLATPGTVRISIFSTTPFTGAGPLAFVQFNVIGSAGTGSPLGLTRADINEGAISTCRNGGGFTACGTPNATVTGVTVSGHVATTVAWTGLGVGIRYDVASGSLATLQTDKSTIAASCLTSDAATPSTVDFRSAPAAGDGYYYLVRPQDACSIGTYGQASNGDERWPAATCP